MGGEVERAVGTVADERKLEEGGLDSCRGEVCLCASRRAKFRRKLFERMGEFRLEHGVGLCGR